MPDLNQDELTLIGRDEKSLGQKILAVLGGITSFGSLFPLFSRYIQKFVDISPKSTFLIFKLLYFIIPLVFLFFWVKIINNRINGYLFKKYIKSFFSGKDWRRPWPSDNTFPATAIKDNASRFLLVCVLMQCGLGILAILITHFLHLQLFWGWLWFIVYVTVFVAQLFIFKKQFCSGAQRDLLTFSALYKFGFTVFFLLFILIGARALINKDNTHSGDGYSSYKFLDGAGAPVSSLEKRTRNICERFRFKSHMQWVNDNVPDSVVKHFNTILENAYCYENIDIKPYIRLFNAMITDKDTNIASLDTFLKRNHIDEFKYADSFFLKADNLYATYRTEKWKDTSKKLYDSLADENKLVYIRVIDNVMFNSLDAKLQLIDANNPLFKTNNFIYLLNNEGLINLGQWAFDSLELKNDSARDIKIVRNAADIKLKNFIESDSLIELRRRQFAHYLNEVNSIRLYSWMEEFIAYAQRQTQDKIIKAYVNTTWILQEAQFIGLLIFCSFLMTLLLYALVIQAGKRRLREKAEQEIHKDAGDEALNVVKNKLENNLRILDYYAFPTNIFIAILFALIIPLLKPIKVDEINTSRPDWFLAMPNWNVISAVDESLDKAKGRAGGEQPEKDGRENNGRCDCKPQAANLLSDGDASKELDLKRLEDKIDSLQIKVDHYATKWDKVIDYVNAPGH